MKYEKSYGYTQPSVRVVTAAEETCFEPLSASDNAAFWVDFTLNIKAEDEYLMLPACAYDGNRFDAVSRKYPPMYQKDELGEHAPTRMTQVPRMAREGDSFMDVTSGDLAVPCVAVLDRAKKEGLLLFFEQGVKGLNHGVSVERKGDRLSVRLRAPACRRLVYRWYEGIPSLRENPAADAPLSVAAGEKITIAHRIFTFPCESITELYRVFFEKRYMLYTAGAHASLPFSAFWEMEEERLNRLHYVEKYGYYALNARDGRDLSPYSDWQAGWVGGGMNTLALLWDGNELSKERAVNTLLFAAEHQSPIGFYYAVVADGKNIDDSFGMGGHTLLIRKHADLTCFFFRQIASLKKLNLPVPQRIFDSAVKAADALVKLWKTYGQLGQFVDCETGEIVVGGSTSGAMAPAALCAAWQVTGNDKYLECAKEMADFFYETATKPGVTTGGPGEILSAPDSESAAALVESDMALYEITQEKLWLDRARDAAHQLASWVVSYDYLFPKESRFAQMDIHAAGSVWANVQNKHSAPGLCTMSPAIFLKLYRATGEMAYLKLMGEIAHFMPQVVSRPDRPMTTVSGGQLLWGEMCERVNLSDWEGNENVGDSIFGASSWPECSLVLTWLEIPGVYAIPSRGVVCVSDHVNASLDQGELILENPTAYPARVKVMIESEDDLKKPLGMLWQDKFKLVSVQPGERVRVAL